MKLIGMLDSPYVRRVAVTLKRLGIPFEHQAVSVFSTFEAFKAINPVVKAPTLVTDDGQVLMDSTLIVDYLEALAGSGSGLMPTALPARLRTLRLVGLALAACEKTVQIVYERNLRPAEKQHEPWVERVGYQLSAAYAELEDELARQPLVADDAIGQDGISVAVAWRFTTLLLPGWLDEARFPRLVAFSAAAEALPLFSGTPPV